MNFRLGRSNATSLRRTEITRDRYVAPIESHEISRKTVKFVVVRFRFFGYPPISAVDDIRSKGFPPELSQFFCAAK